MIKSTPWDLVTRRDLVLINCLIIFSVIGTEVTVIERNHGERNNFEYP